MSRSSSCGQQHHAGLGRAATGAADLLVVGDRGLRRAEVDDEAERGVEAHAERRGGDQRLDPARDQVGLQRLPLGRVGLAGVGRHLVPALAQVGRDLLGGGDGEAVDDARPGLLGEVVGQPGQPLLGGPQPQHPQPQRLPVERAAQHEHAGALVGRGVEPAAELLGDVGGHPGVGGRGGGQHRDAVGQVAQQGPDPAVVGPEVVAPVGDAVRLVDHQQARRGGQPGQHLVAEARVVEPLGAHQQHVDLAGVDRVVDRLPLLDVGGVDRHRPDAGALGGLDLVAHQREQRRHDHGRPGPAGSAAAGWPRSRPPTCPTRCAGRRGRGAGRRRGPRSPTTGPRAGRRRRVPPGPGGGARPRRARRSRRHVPSTASPMRRGLRARTNGVPTAGRAPEVHEQVAAAAAVGKAGR